MAALVQDATGLDLSPGKGWNLPDAKEAAATVLEAARKGAGAVVAACPSVGHVLNAVFEEVVEKTLVQPTFVTEHPIEISPLAKPHRRWGGWGWDGVGMGMGC